MFDKLVESDTTGAEFKKRGRYFMVSSVVVGILFLTAVVYSLYATEIGLGSASFEIADFYLPHPIRATRQNSHNRTAQPPNKTAVIKR